MLGVTVIETLQFLRQADDVWADDERTEFVDFIARNPEAGDVIPETGGLTTTRTKLNEATKLSNRTGIPYIRDYLGFYADERAER